MEENTVFAAAKEKLVGSYFALPATVVEPHIASLAERNIAPKRRNVRRDPYVLDAYVFEEAPDSIGSVFAGVYNAAGEAPFADTVTVRFGNRKLPYFCGKTGAVKLVPQPAKGRDSSKVEQELERKSYFSVQGVLERFSRLAGGFNIKFYAEDRHDRIPPPPDQENTINIYPWNHPLGDSETHYKSRVFNLLLDKDGDKIIAYRGVPGCGELISDGKIDIVQMIGNQWYMLFAVIEYFNEHTTVRILEETLAATLKRYQALKRGAQPANAVRRADRKHFVQATTEWLNTGLDHYEDAAKKKRAGHRTVPRIPAGRRTVPRGLTAHHRGAEERRTHEAHHRVVSQTMEAHQSKSAHRRSSPCARRRTGNDRVGRDRTGRQAPFRWPVRASH